MTNRDEERDIMTLVLMDCRQMVVVRGDGEEQGLGLSLRLCYWDKEFWGDWVLVLRMDLFSTPNYGRRSLG